jgi:tRNA/rRNA methyltransferase
MGLSDLVVVAPADFAMESALKTATHAAADVLHRARFYPDLKEALAPFNLVACTTARTGKERSEVLTPETAAEKIMDGAEKNRTAILFGPEDRGLTNSETILADMMIRIPTAGFSSLNLSQAVMVICYELHKKAVHRNPAAGFAPRVATRHELDGMYSQMDETFKEIGFVFPDHPDSWVPNMRKFLSRQTLRSKEVRMIRSLLKQIQTLKKHQI